MGETRGGSVQWRGLGCCRPGAHASTPLFPLWVRSYIVLWIALSAAVILINKYVLAVSGFPFPIALTLTHMGFCSSLAFVLIKLGVSDTAHMDSSTYMRWVSSHWCNTVQVHGPHGRRNIWHISISICDTYVSCAHNVRRCVLPIAALFSGTLWMGNAAYLYLSVAFIQMIKASVITQS